MKIARQEAKLFNNGKSCTVHSYAFPSSLLGLITADMDGRYPGRGKVRNERCVETYYVSSGSCVVHHESGDYQLSEGDVFFFPKGKWYWIEAEKLKLVVCTAPPWTAEQHKQLS